MKKILAVDDNPDILQSIVDVLEEIGAGEMEIKTAEGGKKCLEALQTYQPDLIMMDIMMPGMDGFETAKKVKKNKNLKSTPILFLSAKSDSLSMQMCSECGDNFLEKPFSAENLYLTVKKILGV